MPAPGFAATKRTGFVLKAARTLDWLQAQQALECMRNPEQPHGQRINDALMRSVEKEFGSAVAVRQSANRPEPQLSRRYFGPVFLTGKVSCREGDFEVQISASITICVSTTVKILDQDPIDSQSKFWVSAIITSEKDTTPLSKDGEERLAALCKRIDKLAKDFLESSISLYSDVMSDQLCDDVSLTVSENRLFSFIFQVKDSKFRRTLERINDRACTLSEATASKSFKAIDDLFSSPASRYFLNYSRSDIDTVKPDVTVDSFVASDRFDARAFVIETKLAKGRGRSKSVEWHMLGVTSATEPQHPSKETRSRDRKLGQNPAHSISNELANLMGAQF